MIIYFKEKILSEVCQKMKESMDMVDVYKEIIEIKRILTQLESSTSSTGLVKVLFEARQLDSILRGKYPEIENMLAIANTMPKAVVSLGVKSNITECEEKIRLEQDYYGIICGVAVKKGISKNIEDIIDKVT